MRRGPLREVLLWTILVAGAIWVVLNAIVQIRFVWFTGRFASVPSSVFIGLRLLRGSRTRSSSLRLAPTSRCGSPSARTPAEDRRLRAFSPEKDEGLGAYPPRNPNRYRPCKAAARFSITRIYSFRSSRRQPLAIGCQICSGVLDVAHFTSRVTKSTPDR